LFWLVVLDSRSGWLILDLECCRRTKLVSRLNKATKVAANDLAQPFVDHGGMGLDPERVAKLFLLIENAFSTFDRL
jgi:hypothetical protein